MARVVINNRSILAKVAKKVDEINKQLKSETLLNEVGDLIIKDNQRNAKTGKGFDSEPELGQKRSKMPALKASTIETRKYLARAKNNESDVYSLRRSNLSMSGQLLSSFVKSIKNGVLTITFSDAPRKRYKTLGIRESKSRKPAPSNKKVAEGLEKQGRYFLGIDDLTEKKIKTNMIRFIRRLIRS